jgi:predicted PurR-regulated permease PerM
MSSEDRLPPSDAARVPIGTDAGPPPGPSSDDATTERRALGSRERRSHATGWRSRDVLRATALASGYLLALALVWVAREIVLTAFLGMLFGLAVGSATERLARWRIPRGLGAALVVFGFLGALYGVGAAIAPTLREQGALLRERVPEAVDRIEAWVGARPGIAGLLLGGREVTAARKAAHDSVVAAAARVPARRAASPEIVSARADSAGAASVPTLRQRVTEQLSGAARYLFPFLSSTITVAAGLFLILVLSIYIGADPRLYHYGLMHLFPHGSRGRAGEVLTRVATVLRKWLVTQLIAMVTIGVVSTVVLLALHVKAAVALGVIAGLLEFVPTVGPILAAVPAIAMGFLDSPEKALSVTLAYLVIQQLEGHVLIPMLMKEGMDLPPALTIVAQAVMALLFGFLGLMVAVPVLAAVIVPIKMLYVEGVIGDADDDTA